jgi:nicotinate-nucleotide pyrophosphorylase (carboxylating)
MSRTTCDVIGLALAEDIGGGDRTVEFFTDADRVGTARIVVREECVIAGIETAAEVFRRVDPELAVTSCVTDGCEVRRGDVVMEIRGRVGSILTAERTALNFLQRLSGVATATRRHVDAVAGTRAKVLDTRKTTPGMRAIEKAAVKAGGGTNHRMGLFDMAMVKDNHLAEFGDVARLQRGIDTLRREHPGMRVELEAETLDQLMQFLALLGVDVVLLDNMDPGMLREAVRLRDETAPAVLLEASGGITLETIRNVAETGVDFISVGALTHSARAVDLSLELEDAR